MHLVDVTNSYRRMVENQLAATSAQQIRVYSLGNTTAIYSKSRRHNDIVLSNKERKVRDQEIDFVIDQLMPEVDREKLRIKQTEKRRVIDITERKEIS